MDDGLSRRKPSSYDDPEKSGSLDRKNGEHPPMEEDLAQGTSQVRGIETSKETALERGLKARHITMIAIGGALGRMRSRAAFFWPGGTAGLMNTLRALGMRSTRVTSASA